MLRPSRLVHAAVLTAMTVVMGAQPAVAAPPVPTPAELYLGDSLAWQPCGGEAQRFSQPYLRSHDGGCYGWSGATTADLAFMVQGGRFQSDGPGQPHPVFLGRGQVDQWSVREAIDRADVVVYSLGTNDANRRTGCADIGTYTPWPVQIPNQPGSGPNPPPCQQDDQQFAAAIDYLVWLAAGKPVLWFDVGVLNPDDPAYAHQGDINRQLYAATARWPNLRVLPWSLYAAARPDLLRADGVHLTPAGELARTRLITDAVRGATT